MEDFTEPTYLDRLCQALEQKRKGMLTNLMEQTESPYARGLFIFIGQAVDPTHFRSNVRPRRCQPASESGAAFDRVRAKWATLCKLLERYAAAIYDPSQLVLGSAKQLDERIAPLNEYLLFSRERNGQSDFPRYALDPDLPRYWVPALELSEDDGGTLLVPALLVHSDVDFNAIEENFTQNASTGLSCGPSFHDALRGGLSEVIERDAIASMWQLRYPAPRILLSDAMRKRLLPGVQVALRNEKIRILLWSITTDTGIPVVMAMADSPHDGLFAFGASADSEVERAIDKAVIECLHGLACSQPIIEGKQAISNLDQLADSHDHLCYYLDPTRRGALEFLLESKAEVFAESLARPAADLQSMIDHLKRLGHRTLAVDITPKDVADLGLSVVRVVVPGLQPLLFGKHSSSLDERRLRVLAAHWQLGAFPALNPHPHPFRQGMASP